MEQNRSEILKGILEKLDQGGSQEEAKKEFAEKLGNLSQEELAEAEKQLIASGVKPEEIQKVCDIHASVYLASHQPNCQADCASCQEQEGASDLTPLTIMEGENQGILNGATYLKEALQGSLDSPKAEKIKKAFDFLKPFSLHYVKKEDLFFPYLYRHGVSSVPQVMWGVDNDLESAYKKLSLLNTQESYLANQEELNKLADGLLAMVNKENEILFPLIKRTLSQEEMDAIGAEMPSLGFPFLVMTPKLTAFASKASNKPAKALDGFISFPTGQLALTELETILNTLPVELTFIAKDNKFTYFNQNKEPLFVRTKAQLGDNVEFCHPVKALPAVRKILADLSSGQKDSVDFLMKENGKTVYNRYLAVKSAQGAYLGCLEVSQEVDGILNAAKARNLI